MKGIKFIGSMVLSCLLIGGCQKRQEKSPPRCIYDQDVFAEAALSAVKEDAEFARFKQNPFFNLLWENLSREEGEKSLEVIEVKYPFLKEKYALLRAGDDLGSPRVFTFGEAGVFSPSTLRHAAIAGELQLRCGCWEGLNVVQIGAGYGGLCMVMSAISTFASYTVVDLPEQLALAKKCLERLGIKNVAFLTPEELPKNGSYDLVVSDMSFSEFNKPFQILFFDRILCRSRQGFLVGRVFPKHYGIAPLNLDALKSRFEKGGKLSDWEMQEPTLETENYLICFKQRG